MDRLIALKILSSELASDTAFLERFAREARVLARLDHPNIVTVFQTGSAGPFAYLIMEYVEGENLRQAIKAGRFQPEEVLSLARDICEPLQFAHEQGILQRDIKPENILITSRGEVKIADPPNALSTKRFDREWAHTVVERSLQAGQTRFDQAGKSQQFTVLKPWLTGETEDLSQGDAARALGLSTGAVKVAIHRLRSDFRSAVEAEIAQTVPCLDDLAEELRYLVEVLS